MASNDKNPYDSDASKAIKDIEDIQVNKPELLDSVQEKDSIYNEKIVKPIAETPDDQLVRKFDEIPVGEPLRKKKKRNVPVFRFGLPDDSVIKPIPNPLELKNYLPPITNKIQKGCHVIKPTELRANEEDIIKKISVEECDEENEDDKDNIEEIIESTDFWSDLSKNITDPNTQIKALQNVINDYIELYNNNIHTNLEPEIYKKIDNFFTSLQHNISDNYENIKDKIKNLQMELTEKHNKRNSIIQTYLNLNKKTASSISDSNKLPFNPHSSAFKKFSKKAGKRKGLNKTKNIKNKKKYKKVKMTKKRKYKKRTQKRK